MKCRICDNESDDLFKLRVLNKYSVSYYRCGNCGFLQTEEPYWLKEAYSQAISDLDTGIIARNLSLAEKTSLIIKSSFDVKWKFLDYAGGYGMFVRLMRDKGFNFYHYDKFCQNLFARHFDIGNEPDKVKERFELVTAFEFLEHLPDPMNEINKILELTDSLLFSTELIPKGMDNLKDWWYLSAESGTHVSFYTCQTLKAISEMLKCALFSNGSNLHMLTRRNLKKPCFLDSSRFGIMRSKFSLILSRLFYQNNSSLIWQDHDTIREILTKK